jgi:hypothetical protein
MLPTTYLTTNYVVAQEYRRARPSVVARAGKYPALPTPRTAIKYDRFYKQYTVLVDGRALCDCETRKEARELLAAMEQDYREMARARKPRRCWALRRRWALRHNNRLTARLLAA